MTQEILQESCTANEQAEFAIFEQGEILILKKMLNFLSFLVLLYVSGHFKQKKISNFFSD